MKLAEINYEVYYSLFENPKMFVNSCTYIVQINYNRNFFFYQFEPETAKYFKHRYKLVQVQELHISNILIGLIELHCLLYIMLTMLECWKVVKIYYGSSSQCWFEFFQVFPHIAHRLYPDWYTDSLWSKIDVFMYFTRMTDVNDLFLV